MKLAANPKSSSILRAAASFLAAAGLLTATASPAGAQAATEIRLIVNHVNAGFAPLGIAPTPGVFSLIKQTDTDDILLGEDESTNNQDDFTALMCNVPPQVITITDPDALSEIGPFGCTDLRVDAAAPTTLMGIAAVVVEIDRDDGTTETICMVDFAFQGCADFDRDQCRNEFQELGNFGGLENQPLVSWEVDLSDIDFDGEPDCSDDDIDNDGIPNDADSCPEVDNVGDGDDDGDGVGNACDQCPGVDDNNPPATDSDGDGQVDACDNCPGDGNPDQKDLDGDGEGDACDGDVDGDGVADGEDNCEFFANPDQTDLNGNNVGDDCECGSMILSCDDADDFGHCQGLDCGGLYVNAFNSLLANSKAPGKKIFAIGVNGLEARIGFESWNNPFNGGPGAEVVFLNGVSQIENTPFDDAAMIFVPSDEQNTSGGITVAQTEALNTRRDDIIEFINERGGSLLALTSNLIDVAFGYLPVELEIEDREASPGAPGAITDVFPTAAMLELSPDTDEDNMDHAFYHCVFTGPPGFSGLGVLARETPPPQEAVILGGSCVTLSSEVCDNQQDDDGDGDVDCDDEDCALADNCFESNCRDEVDNDGDGLVDCADPDCLNDIAGCPVCGDGNAVTPEECDDGNTVSGDGCAEDCTLEPEPTTTTTSTTSTTTTSTTTTSTTTTSTTTTSTTTTSTTTTLPPTTTTSTTTTSTTTTTLPPTTTTTSTTTTTLPPTTTTTMPPTTTTSTTTSTTSTTSTSTTTTSLPSECRVETDCTQVIDFEGLLEGESADPVFTDDGLGPIGVFADNANLPGENAAIAFDSNCGGGCSGEDPDLGTPNQTFGGPGIGTGGMAGSEYANGVPLGKLLIVAEDLVDNDTDGLVDDPDDQAFATSKISFDFSEIGPVTIHQLTIVDIEMNETPMMLQFFNGGVSLGTETLPNTGNNGVAVVELDEPATGVLKMVVTVHGSAAIDDIVLTSEVCLEQEGGDCDDGNPCTDDLCSAETGECLNVPNRAECDDGSLCTLGDTCLEGQCMPGSSVMCFDGNDCTDDSCDPEQGCVFENNFLPCDDGNACTIEDRCIDKECQGTAEVFCEDGNPCTEAWCFPDRGCVQENILGPCDDGDACTTDDQCLDGECKSGAELVCSDDGDPCTSQTCDSELGCVTMANDGAQCDDEDPCTVEDMCLDGQCVGRPMDCDDGNPCTVPYECVDGECPTGEGVILDCCGNGLVEEGEECDDGDMIEDNGCNTECRVDCGDANVSGDITSVDSLRILNKAVGNLVFCPMSLCDVDSSGYVLANDALMVLLTAVGHAVDLICPPEYPGSSTTTTTTSTTSTSMYP